jgi:hypothetical protein
MLDDIGPGSLKLVITGDDSCVRAAMLEHVPDNHIRPAGNGAWIIFTEADVADVRDWLVTAVGDAAQIFVVEFEHWSGHGDIDAAWLLRRGH